MKIGARGSDLAQFQARWVKERLQLIGIESELVIISTLGDRVQDKPLDELGVQGVFTREIENALIENRIDLAVHSFKDLAMKQPIGLSIAAITGREDPADVLLMSPDVFSLHTDKLQIVEGAVIGTSAVRRREQLISLRPDLKIEDLRGNVPTRIQKLREGKYDAIILAQAGVNRLSVDIRDLRTQRLDPLKFIPSPGQGALAIEMRSDNQQFETVRNLLNDDNSATATGLERSILYELGGGCSLPLGAYARSTGGKWQIKAFYGESSSNKWAEAEGELPSLLPQRIMMKLGIKTESVAKCMPGTLTQSLEINS